VAHNREALEPELPHQPEQLRRHLALAVALAPRAAGRGGGVSVATEVGRYDGEAARQAGQDLAPAVMGLGETVKEEDGGTRAFGHQLVARIPDAHPTLFHSTHPASSRGAPPLDAAPVTRGVPQNSLDVYTV